VEPFRLFVDDSDRNKEGTVLAEDYLECLSTGERQNLSKRLINLISDDIERLLQPENKP
jgi:uncharacterized small protein (DUF1192 family)